MFSWILWYNSLKCLCIRIAHLYVRGSSDLNSIVLPVSPISLWGIAVKWKWGISGRSPIHSHFNYIRIHNATSMGGIGTLYIDPFSKERNLPSGHSHKLDTLSENGSIDFTLCPTFIVGHLCNLNVFFWNCRSLLREISP